MHGTDRPPPKTAQVLRLRARPNRKAVQRLKNGRRYPPTGKLKINSKNPCGTGVFCIENPGRGSRICRSDTRNRG